MEPAIARGPSSVAFEDGLGTRHHTVDVAGEHLEIFALREELTLIASFDFALRERVSRLANFRHACYGHVRGVSRLDPTTSKLALVSDRVLGDRLSDILRVADRELLPLNIGAGLCLIRQLVDAVAILHQTVRDVCHGAIASERIIITPDARLVIVEHVLGAALGSLAYSRDRFWKELRIALPPTAGAPRLDRRADVTQVGVIALALFLGRPIGDDDYPDRIGEIAGRVGAVSAEGGLEPLADAMRTWLRRALQLDPHDSFASAVEARDALDEVLLEAGYTATPAALKSFLAQYHKSAARTPAPAPAPAARPPAVPASAPRLRAPAATAPDVKRKPIERSEPAHRQHSYMPLRGIAGEAEGRMRNRSHSPRRRLMAVAVLLVAVASVGTMAARQYLTPAAAAIETTGMLVVNTNPVGVAVAIDGQHRGATPLSVYLTPGDHVFELVTDGDRRSIPVKITAGGQVSQFIEMPKTVPSLGELHVRTEPSGAKVTVDGHFFGTSPITVNKLTPGVHLVVLENELGSLREEVTVEAGTTASLVVPLKAPQAAPVSGWISVVAPVDVQLYENRHLLGSSRTSRIMVPVGRHDLEIMNEALGYRASRTVTVSPGQVSSIKLAMPRGALAVNALPWAEVWIDGERVGETPIGNVSVPIGTHDVIFRHPDLGERRHTVTVTMMDAARLSVDLRKK